MKVAGPAFRARISAVVMMVATVGTLVPETVATLVGPAVNPLAGVAMGTQEDFPRSLDRSFNPFHRNRNPRIISMRAYRKRRVLRLSCLELGRQAQSIKDADGNLIFTGCAGPSGTANIATNCGTRWK